MHPWLFTKWLSEFGLSDLFAAVGTVGAVFLAVHQAGAARRDRREAAVVALRVALGVAESGAALLARNGTPAYIGARCEALRDVLTEIPLAQMQDLEAVEALMLARGALHVISDRASRIAAAEVQGRRLKVKFTKNRQRDELEQAASILRSKLKSKGRKIAVLSEADVFEDDEVVVTQVVSS